MMPSKTTHDDHLNINKYATKDSILKSPELSCQDYKSQPQLQKDKPNINLNSINSVHSLHSLNRSQVHDISVEVVPNKTFAMPKSSDVTMSPGNYNDFNDSLKQCTQRLDTA